MRDSNCITQHQVGAGGRIGGYATHNVARQNQDMSPAKNKTDLGDTHALYCWLQGMGNRGGE